MAALVNLVDMYVKSNRPEAKNELDFFHNASWDDAVEYAGFAIDRDRRRFSHQRRLRAQSLFEAYGILLSNRDEINTCSSFENLYSIIREVVIPIYGIGVLYAYDTSLRLGAHRNLHPKMVYLHAGARVGARELRNALELTFDPRARALCMGDFPDEMKPLSPREVENFLCIYKREFFRLGTNNPAHVKERC